MKIEIWADVACPWCYIGERRLRRAIEDSGVAAEVHWKPYQLQPDLPSQGIPWSQFVDERFGGWQRARPAFERVAASGAGDGIEYDFKSMASAPNTTDAHRLLLHAESAGRLWEAADAVYRGYFREGRDVGSRSVLVEIGTGLGLDPSELGEMLDNGQWTDQVAASQDEARELGISGVPFVVLEDELAVSGAQPLEVFRSAIDRARSLVDR
jgi:predicted DsbA family dithiol-disulfide isomerase